MFTTNVTHHIADEQAVFVVDEAFNGQVAIRTAPSKEEWFASHLDIFCSDAQLDQLAAAIAEYRAAHPVAPA